MLESNSSTDRVGVGRLGRAHGLRGEVYLVPDTDNPDRFLVGAEFSTDEDPPRRLELLSLRRHQSKLLACFGGIEDRTAAESLQGVLLTIAADERRRLADDEYWPDELVGLEARDPSGHPVGTVEAADIEGAQDRLVVRTLEGRQVLIPFVKDLVPQVRVADGFVVIDPIEGLLSPSPD